MNRRADSTAGWSLPELMIVLCIISILANVAVPLARDAILRAHASALAEDFVRVRQAALDWHQGSSVYPPEARAGVVPPEIAAALGKKVDFSAPAPNARLDWENWESAAGEPVQPQTGVLIGLTLVTADPALIRAVQRTYTGCFVRTGYGRYTFVIEPIPGESPC